MKCGITGRHFFFIQRKKKGTPITEDFILQLHAIIYQHGTGRKPLKSRYRQATGPGVLFAVFDNKTRQPEYIPPEYSDVPRSYGGFYCMDKK